MKHTKVESGDHIRIISGEFKGHTGYILGPSRHEYDWTIRLKEESRDIDVDENEILAVHFTAR
jgi:ribosomal protein L24